MVRQHFRPRARRLRGSGWGVCLFMLLGSWGGLSQADTANLRLGLTITMPPQCNFNDGSNMQIVRFGEVQQGLIDGVSYARRQINTGVSCSRLEKAALRMTVSWSGITLDGQSAVSTNRAGLGIAIYREATRLGNGSSLSFNYYDSPPALYAVPVKSNGMMLTDAGSFTGQMTVTLNYQ